MEAASSSDDDGSSNESIVWNVTTDVIQPIPDYMAAILAEMRRRYDYSTLRFHGDVVLLRWNLDDGEIQTCFNAPDEIDAIDNEFYVGRYWMPYECNSALCMRPHSPAWSLFLEIGVVKTDMNAGMQFQIQLESFPAEHFSEKVYDQHHIVASMEEWTAFKRDVLDGLMALQFKRIEDEVQFGLSEESTEPNSENDEMEMDSDDDGEM